MFSLCLEMSDIVFGFRVFLSGLLLHLVEQLLDSGSCTHLCLSFRVTGVSVDRKMTELARQRYFQAHKLSGTCFLV